jgi:uncharacterized membrane-anchored protein YitT (DUF2179 family)
MRRGKLGSSKVWQTTLIYGKIVLGSVLYGIGFQYFLYPNAIIVGGVSGLAMIINYLTRLPVGVMSIVLNIPLFLLAWKKLGFRFIWYSLLGTVLSSAAIDLLSLLPVSVTSEPMLAAVYGGVIKGFGLGLVYSAGATTGGVDICAKLVRQRRPDLRFGTLLLGFDVIVIVAFALIFRKFDSAMYAIITMFILSKVVDLVLYGLTTSKVCYIISDESDKVKNAIVEKLHRGVTMLKGVGAWSGKDKQVILCVIKQQQIVEIRQIVRGIDEAAFMIISDARDVFGNGFGNIRDNA